MARCEGYEMFTAFDRWYLVLSVCFVDGGQVLKLEPLASAVDDDGGIFAFNRAGLPAGRLSHHLLSGYADLLKLYAWSPVVGDYARGEVNLQHSGPIDQ